jgi:prepilin-type processing-associated H-X9-DG protein
MTRSHVHFTPRRVVGLFALLAVCSGTVCFIRERQVSSDRERCRRNIRGFALALVAHDTVHGTFPRGTLSCGNLSPEQRLSWVSLVLNWTDCYQSSFLFEPHKPWDSPGNLLPRIDSWFPDGPDRIRASPEPPRLSPLLMCPANHCKVGQGLPGPMHYVGIAGSGTDAPSLPTGHRRAGIFGYDRQTQLVDIPDGASITMMLAETTLANGPWTAGGPPTVRGLDQGRQPYLGHGRQFGGAHPGGAMVAFADGSVRFVSETIAPSVFEAISTIAGGEALAEGWDR